MCSFSGNLWFVAGIMTAMQCAVQCTLAPIRSPFWAIIRALGPPAGCSHLCAGVCAARPARRGRAVNSRPYIGRLQIGTAVNRPRRAIMAGRVYRPAAMAGRRWSPLTLPERSRELGIGGRPGHHRRRAAGESSGVPRCLHLVSAEPRRHTLHVSRAPAPSGRRRSVGLALAGG